MGGRTQTVQTMETIMPRILTPRIPATQEPPRPLHTTTTGRDAAAVGERVRAAALDIPHRSDGLLARLAMEHARTLRRGDRTRTQRFARPIAGK
jgi:hypothetical protein